MSWTSYVEKSGSGTGEILDKCVEYGLARPEFDPTTGFFKTIIWRAGIGNRIKGPSRRGLVKGLVEGASQGLVEGASCVGSKKRAQEAGPRNGDSRHLVGTQSRHPLCHGAEESIQERVIAFCDVPRSTKELLDKVGRSDRTKFKRFVLRVLMEDGILEWTIPDKPNSRLQKYRLTAKGRKVAATLVKNATKPKGKGRGK